MIKDLLTAIQNLFEGRRPGRKSFGLGRIKIEESQLQQDWELTDRYQAFSSEILRLAGLGIAIIGFLYEKSMQNLTLPLPKALAGASGLLFAAAIVFALLHRYYSTDTMACQIRYLRLSKRKSEDSLEPNELAEIETESVNERELWHGRLKSCGVWLVLAAIAFGAAGVLLSGSFAQLLFP